MAGEEGGGFNTTGSNNAFNSRSMGENSGGGNTRSNSNIYSTQSGYILNPDGTVVSSDGEGNSIQMGLVPFQSGCWPACP